MQSKANCPCSFVNEKDFAVRKPPLAPRSCDLFRQKPEPRRGAKNKKDCLRRARSSRITTKVAFLQPSMWPQNKAETSQKVPAREGQKGAIGTGGPSRRPPRARLKGSAQGTQRNARGPPVSFSELLGRVNLAAFVLITGPLLLLLARPGSSAFLSLLAFRFVFAPIAFPVLSARLLETT